MSSIPNCLAARCRCSRTRRAGSATRRSGTGARSAGRSRTPTPPLPRPPGRSGGARPPSAAAATRPAPASAAPAVLLALAAPLAARGPGGEREIGIGDFFQGLFETTLEPDELLTEIRVPKPASAGWSFQKFAQRGLDWAIVGCAAQDGKVALVNMGGTPLRATAVESALAGGASPAEAAAHAAEGTSAARS